jgi:prephenate dehydrogenase
MVLDIKGCIRKRLFMELIQVSLQSIALGVIDAAGNMEELHADFVIVSVPVDGALVVLPQVLDLIGEKRLYLK